MNTAGERFVPNAGMGVEIELEHMQRYVAIAPYVKGKVVLDAACGAGYGSAILAEYAKLVIGIDIDHETIEQAKNNFHRSNTIFREMSITSMDFREDEFDAIISFETIEHISEEDQHAFLKDTVRILKNDGFLAISTPDLDSFMKKSGGTYHNPFHIKEYNYEEYKKFLALYYDYVDIQYQERLNCAVIEGKAQRPLNEIEKFEQGDYMIAICSNKSIILNLSSVYFPDTDSNEIHSFLYYDLGQGYREENKYELVFKEKGNNTFNIECRIEVDNIIRIRFDPVDFPALISISAIDQDEKDIEFKPMNANSSNEMDLFMHWDPSYEHVLRHGEKIDNLMIKVIYKKVAIADVCDYWANEIKDKEIQISETVNRVEELRKREDELGIKIEKLEHILVQKEKIETELRDTLKEKQDYYTDQINSLTNENRMILQSTSWKITKSIRWCSEFLRRIKRKAKNTIRGVYGNNKYQPMPYDDRLCYRQGTKSYEIPKEWIQLFKNQYKITIVIAVKGDLENVKQSIDSIIKQQYRNFEIIIVSNENNEELRQLVLEYSKEDQVKIIECNSGSMIEDFWKQGVEIAEGDYIGVIEQGDFLNPYAFSYIIEVANEYPDARIITVRDDVVFDGVYQFKDEKVGMDFLIGGKESILHFSVFQKGDAVDAVTRTLEWREEIDGNEIKVIPRFLYHISSQKDEWMREPSVRCLAFYLPQFHIIPENNQWWGEGFTEWVNVRKAHPLYTGHNQPRVPDNYLGYYDLGDEEGYQVQQKQFELAKKYGIYGFCYYYYWFDNGKKLLEKPVNRHLNNKEWDFPFCICWANENWTRSWDGLNNEVLMPQTYLSNWEEKFVLDIIPLLKDDRYIKVGDAPFLLIYNIAEIKNVPRAINRIRSIAKENGINKIHISAVRRSMDASELATSGYTIDSLTDFPPHLIGTVGVDHDEPWKYGRNKGYIKDYKKACEYHANMGKQPYTYFKTAMLRWDNTARRGDKSYVFEEFTFDEYKKWLYGIKRYSMRQNRPGEDLIFINAWNEWAEGTYLEPDKKDGFKALESTLEVLEMR